MSTTPQPNLLECFFYREVVTNVIGEKMCHSELFNMLAAQLALNITHEVCSVSW